MPWVQYQKKQNNISYCSLYYEKENCNHTALVKSKLGPNEANKKERIIEEQATNHYNTPHSFSKALHTYYISTKKNY